MYDAFESLPDEKKQRIIDGCLDEFATYGYDKSSTNRIIKKIGISKGSLFNYFNTKEKLYFYILDYVIEKINGKILNNINDLPDDLFARIYAIAEIEYDIYTEKPKFYKLFKKAFTSNNKVITGKISERYSVKANKFFYLLLENINTDNLKWSKEKVIDIIRWVLEGLNDEFIMANLNSDVKRTKEEYLQELTAYINILKEGMVREKI